LSNDSIETRALVKRKYAKKAQVLTIGEGGKNLSRFAAVMSDTGKALGRGGGGAVWGSKNLYAVAVVPNREIKIEVTDKESFNPENESGAMYHVKLKMDVGKFTKKEDMFGILASMGSLGILGMVNNYNQLIHNNMKDTIHRIEDINKINGEALRYHYQSAKPGEKKIKVKKSACFNCPIVCKRETTLYDENNNLIEKGEGPEFESTTLMGANLSIYNLPIITRANNLANRWGLDTISLGATIASFFELYKIINEKKEDLSSLEKQFMDDVRDFIDEYGEPGFGREDLLIPITNLIGTSKGIGKYLAEGSYKFCSRYGHKELSMSVKGMELPAYDPRTSFSQALCYEMNNRGGCHLEGGYTAPHAYCAGYSEWPPQRVEGTPLISKNATLKNTTLDIIGACAYGSFSLGLDEYASLVNAVTGEEHNSGTLKQLAQRTITLERCFNYLCGLTEANDWLPDRFYTESIDTKDGCVICDRESFRKMHKEYYNSVGWDDKGKPTYETLKKLELLDYIPSNSIQVKARYMK
jgi:aldehyde:ferredoxin oxidoreductase